MDGWMEENCINNHFFYLINRNISDVEYWIAVATNRFDDAVGTPTSPVCITLTSKCS